MSNCRLRSAVKTPVSAGTDAAEVLDRSTENFSAKKKRKKPDSRALGAAGNTIGGMRSSGPAATAHGVSDAKEYAVEVANRAQNSIMGDVTQVAEAVVEANNIAEASEKKTSKSKPKGKKKVKGADTEDPREAEAIDAAANGQDPAAGDKFDKGGEEDDQTLELLKVYDSGDEDQFSGEEIFRQGQDVPRIPPKSVKKLEAAKEELDGPGVVFVGHIPHGFYEHEMRAYFSQFGPITRLRLSRNRKTGRSKHYAFIEFESASVAKIVASTMDKYLLFGHILRCKFAAPETLHPDLWRGANKRFKTVPWNKIEGRKLELPMGREGWEKRIEKEKKRREERSDAMKAFGYEYEGGELKGVNEVPARKLVTEIEGAPDVVIEEEKTLDVERGQDNGRLVITEISTKKRKRGGKTRPKEDVSDAAISVAQKTEGAEDVVQEQASPPPKKAKRGQVDIQERASSSLDKIHDIGFASQQQAVAASKETIEKVAAFSVEDAPEATSNAQDQAAPMLKKAKRARANVEHGTTSVAKNVEDTVQDAAAPGLKKTRKAKKAKT